MTEFTRNSDIIKLLNTLILPPILIVGVAQWIAHLTSNQKVAGSSPAVHVQILILYFCQNFVITFSCNQNRNKFFDKSQNLLHFKCVQAWGIYELKLELLT